MDPAEVTLDGVPLAGNQSIVWRLTTGVQPYMTIFTVHQSDWQQLKAKKGKPLTLSITDSRGAKVDVEKVYILHEAPSDAPVRVSFVVADKRWLWAYNLVARDFNVPRKTGTKTVSRASLPELQVNVDAFDYLSYSLTDDGGRWSAQQAIEEVLQILEDKGRGGYRIDSLPTAGSSASAGQLTIQGVALRDQGDIALAKMLSYVPGAEVFVDVDGTAVVFNGLDLKAAQDYRNLFQSTWEGDRDAVVDRKQIRPSKIIVNYVRELECLFTYSDDYGPTQASPNQNEPFLENVLPTVEPATVVTEYDPQLGRSVSKTLAPGNWVRVDKWLAAMDSPRPANSDPWTFATIRKYWQSGGLEGVLGAHGNQGNMDVNETMNTVQRVQAIYEHFRRTFRITRRYMERFRDIRPVRAALLDPVTGARAPAAVWGQLAISPSQKGQHMAAPVGVDPAGYSVTRNCDYLNESVAGGKRIVDTTPGPQRVEILDDELGILHVDTIQSPYGTTGATYPCFLVDSTETRTGITRDLAKQDVRPTGLGFQVTSTPTGVYLSNTMKSKIMLTVVPAAPNGTLQFHRIEVTAKDVRPLFNAQGFTVEDGAGPVLEVFVAPTEMTARLAWQDDAQASATLQKLLGLTDNADDVLIGAQTTLPGFLLINEGNEGNKTRHLTAHAQALAAELYAHFADSIQGDLVTVLPKSGTPKIVGNMGSATIAVGPKNDGAPVRLGLSFAGRQRPISRFSLMPDSVRSIVLRVLER